MDTLQSQAWRARESRANHLGWVRDSASVIARTADGQEYARGTVVSYTDRPTVQIEQEDGSRVSWHADMCERAPQPNQGIEPLVQVDLAGTIVVGRGLLTIHADGRVEGRLEDANEAGRLFVESIRSIAGRERSR